MKEIEKLITYIGEFVYTEIDDVEDIDYTKENGQLVAFTIYMRNKKQYLITVSEIA